MIKVGNDSFRQTQFGPKASETISQRRWRGCHFQLLVLAIFAIFWRIRFCNTEKVFAKIKRLFIVRIINKPIGAKFKAEK